MKEICHAAELAIAAAPDIAAVKLAKEGKAIVIAEPMELKAETCKGCGGLCNMKRSGDGKLYLKPPLSCTNKTLKPGKWHLLTLGSGSEEKKRTSGRSRRWKPRFH